MENVIAQRVAVRCIVWLGLEVMLLDPLWRHVMAENLARLVAGRLMPLAPDSLPPKSSAPQLPLKTLSSQG